MSQASCVAPLSCLFLFRLRQQLNLCMRVPALLLVLIKQCSESHEIPPMQIVHSSGECCFVFGIYVAGNDRGTHTEVHALRGLSR